MLILIDGDPIVYSAGFSVDAEAKKMGLDEAPFEWCEAAIKERVNDCIKVCGFEDYLIYLGGVGNFRYGVDNTYKANRVDAPKPKWYNQIREFILDEYNSILTRDEEADDALGVHQMSSDENTCICSVDKDLDCIPGFHYNWGPKRYINGVYHINEVEANRFFYTQCLTGDATDNIPGLKKTIGRIATKKIKEPITKMTDPREMYEYVDSVYGSGGVKVDWLHIARCLWIRREEGELWEPPKEKTT